MMGGVSPETCWASYKYGIIKILIKCCILLDFLYELYYDEWIHKQQVSEIYLNIADVCQMFNNYGEREYLSRGFRPRDSHFEISHNI
jgi:hypothetical protein